MNLVGHVAAAVRDDAPSPPAEFLVGCMLPDLAAIARVRLARPSGELGRGVAFHHACDAAFHESDWFRDRNRELRDELLGAGVDAGAARACAHAGVEMLLDGALVAEARVAECTRVAFAAVDAGAADLAELAPTDVREACRERLQRISRSLDPRRYSDPQFVAERLHRMTAGRRRIELRAEQVPIVARTLAELRPLVVRSSARVVGDVRDAVRGGAAVMR